VAVHSAFGIAVTRCRDASFRSSQIDDVESKMSETDISESTQGIRQLTVAELETVSGGGLPGAPQPDTLAPPTVGAGALGAGIAAAGGGK
jgi:hypothetical protein